VQVDFFKQKSIKSIFSAILDYTFQTQRLVVDASTTKQTHKSFWNSVENWRFGSKNKIFEVLVAILDFAAILDLLSNIKV
jgi:hypothetical protein